MNQWTIDFLLTVTVNKCRVFHSIYYTRKMTRTAGYNEYYTSESMRVPIGSRSFHALKKQVFLKLQVAL